MIQLEDKLPVSLRGIFSYKCYDLSGNLVEDVEVENVILNNAARIIRDLLSGLVDGRIAFMAFGNLNRSNTDTSTPPEAKATDTGLVNELGRVAAIPTTIDINNNPSIIYSAVLDYGELNGTSYNRISEFALLTADGRALNKKNRTPIIKNSSYRYEFKWTLQFV